MLLKEIHQLTAIPWYHSVDDGPFHDQVESDMIQDILTDDRRRARMDATPVEEDIEAALATCRPMPPCVVNEGGKN